MKRSTVACACAFVLTLGGCTRDRSERQKAAPVEAPAANTRGEGDAPAHASTLPVHSSSPAAGGSGPSETRVAPDASADAGVGSADDAGSNLWLTAAPLAGKAVGNTSVAFKLKLEGGLEALYKPRSRRHNGRYRGEIAAYRLAKALGISNVPPAYLRVFRVGALRTALGSNEDALKLFEAEVLPTPAGGVPGALMPWRPRFDILPLEKPEWRAKWKVWLGPEGTVPESERRLAAQISTMIVFDYVTGNGDRWSGGNIVIDQASGTLLFVDNDAAFLETPVSPYVEEQRALVDELHRFSKSFMKSLFAMDGAALARAIGEETKNGPLLSTKSLSGVEARTREVVAGVKAKVAREGESRVFAFE